MLLEDLTLRMPGLEIRVSRNPKFEENRKNDVFIHITVYHTQTPGIFLRVEAGLDGGIMSSIVIG